MVRGGGLEPPRLFEPADFKSAVYTDFTTLARCLEAEAGIEPTSTDLQSAA